jgi:hypothetical protein
MPGKKALPASIRLASGFQLWRLNQLGLGPFAGREPVTSAEASSMLDEELARLGLERFPAPGETWPARVPDSPSDDLPHH